MYLGYGIVTDSNISWKEDAYKNLYELVRKNNGKLYDHVKDYFHENEDEYDQEVEAFPDFCNDYVNEISLASGIEAVISDLINENEFAGHQWFIYEDYCIHVAAYIPQENELQECPTIQKINKLVKQYIQPLVEEEILCSWHRIHEN